MATLHAEGSLESASNVELKCQVAGGSTILWLVGDGTQVKAGDELVRLDGSLMEDQLEQQRIVVEQAKAAAITAERELAAARLALPEYLEGTFVQQQEELAANIVTARHNLRLAEHGLSGARHLERLGFVNAMQRQGNQFAVEQAKVLLGVAERAKQVLEEYNKPKFVQDARTRIETAEALVRSSSAEYALAQAKLKRCQTELEHCVIRATHDGLAIYANDPRRSSSQTPEIELGAFVRQRQPVIRLPDLDRMQARLLVHESSVLRVSPGQSVRVEVRGASLNAHVTEISNQPERMRREQQHIKYFAVTALLDQREMALRPGETAEAELMLDERRDVVRAPLEAIVRRDDGDFAWVLAGETLERRPLSLGARGERMFEIRDGLREGDEVVLAPRDVLAEARVRGPNVRPFAPRDLQATVGGRSRPTVSSRGPMT
ncbi:MAG: efflux RND transporter periplasmic adaptor subunit, partial [Candidatus Saccharimonadales bacterium]